MKFSKSLIGTLRQDPREAESRSHRILLRGGFIRQLAAGIHTYLPLGWRILRRIEQIVREEHERIGAQELLMPAMSPSELWEKSGRLEEYGDDMFRFKDRKDRDYCLCPTHEEIVTEIARAKVRSYRDLPQSWFQIQTKFRDELRPRFGVIRSRQFIMKDSYSLDRDEAGLDRSYQLHKGAYIRIFTRCGIDFELVQASGGVMGKGESHEFIARIDGGEAIIVACTACQYRADIEGARTGGTFASFDDVPLAEIHTPDVGTINEVSSFLEVPQQQLVKSIIFTAPGKKPLLMLLRGDYEISEDVIKNKFGFSYRTATRDEILAVSGVEPGFIGPTGAYSVDIYADDLLKGATGMITGANKNDYHVRGLNIARDVKVKDYFNMRVPKTGDTCMECGSAVELYNALELGQIFKLGTKYSERLGAMFLDEHGEEKPIIMGSYGIGLERIMACVCEQKADERGAVWPISISPYDVYLVVLNPADKKVAERAARISRALTESGFSIIIDDRDISAGIKFNDSELLGIPLRVTIGPRGIKSGQFDVYVRESGEISTVNEDDVVKRCQEMKTVLLEKLEK
jgi:prolyl-tRNA synthetase